MINLEGLALQGEQDLPVVQVVVFLHEDLEEAAQVDLVEQAVHQAAQEVVRLVLLQEPRRLEGR